MIKDNFVLVRSVMERINKKEMIIEYGELNDTMFYRITYGHLCYSLTEYEFSTFKRLQGMLP